MNGSKKLVCGCLVLAVCLVVPAQSQSPASFVVAKVGGYLLGVVRDYIVGKVIDRTVDFFTGKKELEAAQQSLLASLRDRANKSDASIAELNQQLRAVQVQLAAFQKLEGGNLSNADLYHMRDDLTSSMESVKNVLHDHERRLRALEDDMAELRARVTGAAHSGDRVRYPQMLSPSFDCRRARTSAELLICGDPLLSDADGRLGKAYHSLLYFVAGPDRISIRDSQRGWIKWRDEQLATACANNSQVDMNCAMNLWEQRIQQLDRTLNAVSLR